MDDLTHLARAERTDLAALLRTLAPQQWEAPSLCSRWRVCEVVAHLLSYEELSVWGLARRFAQGRFVLDRTNASGVADYADRSPQQLLELLDQSLTPRGLTAWSGGRIALVDGMIHQQDIQRPLGLARDIPPDRLRPALEFARTAPTLGALWRTRGLRLVATDLDWSAGHGPEVRGRSEALLMALSGRRVATAELSGGGQPILAQRIEG